jgi:hypothetical protein
MKNTKDLISSLDQRMNRFVLPNSVYYTQVDNAIDPSSSCFPTSVAMGMIYCLSLIGKTKIDVGCPADKQLEDYINKMTVAPETMVWIRDQVPILGKWMLQVLPRQNFYVEEYIFNKLMNTHGFRSTVIVIKSFDNYCNLIAANRLPIILKGSFKPETQVDGHMICGVGFDRDKKLFVVNDPYANALEKYKKGSSGKEVEYPYNHWFKYDKQGIYSLVISRNA